MNLRPDRDTNGGGDDEICYDKEDHARTFGHWLADQIQ